VGASDGPRGAWLVRWRGSRLSSGGGRGLARLGGLDGLDGLGGLGGPAGAIAGRIWIAGQTVLVAAVMSRSVLVPIMSSEAPGLVRELSMPTRSRTLRGVVLGASSAFEDGRCAWTQDRLKAARARVRVHDEGMSGVAERGTPVGDERHVSLQMRTLGGAFMPSCHHATMPSPRVRDVPSSCRAVIQTRL
jgi:hypothetical protein